MFLWICTLSFLYNGRSQQKTSLDINECQLLRPLEQSAQRGDSYWTYFEYKGKRWTQKNCWPSCSHVIRSFTLFSSVILSISLYPWWPCLSLCDYFFFLIFVEKVEKRKHLIKTSGKTDVSDESNFNLPHCMSICLWHRAIVGYIREVKIAYEKGLWITFTRRPCLFRQQIYSFCATWFFYMHLMINTVSNGILNFLMIVLVVILFLCSTFTSIWVFP